MHVILFHCVQDKVLRRNILISIELNFSNDSFYIFLIWRALFLEIKSLLYIIYIYITYLVSFRYFAAQSTEITQIFNVHHYKTRCNKTNNELNPLYLYTFSSSNLFNHKHHSPQTLIREHNC